MTRKPTDRVTQLIEAYITQGYSSEVERDFAEWLADARQSDHKDKALASLWNSFTKRDRAATERALLRLKARLGHPLPHKQRSMRWPARIAAVLLPLAIILSAYIHLNRPTTDTLVAENMVSLSSADSMICRPLPDNSIVWLHDHSSIEYAEMPDGVRHVALQGEACFKVTETPDHEVFEVQTRRLTIKVHGTEFNVKEYAEQNYTEITLYEGSVEVMLADKSLMMRPGTQLTYDHASRRTSTTPIPHNHVNWRYDMLHFDGEDISTILERIALFYELTLKADDRGRLSRAPLSIWFDGTEDAEHIMSVLERLSGSFTYRLTQDTIYITPK